MASPELIDRTTTPDGEALTLGEEAGHHVVRVRGELLMSSRVSGSEAALADLALSERAPAPNLKVLLGGLGMGFTLRALLDRIAADAVVEVVELFECVVRWNHGVLGDHAEQPLNDPRVTVTVDDFVAYLAHDRRTYDLILIDIDNGPEAFTVAANERLYAASGLTQVYRALTPGGVLVLWSAFRDPRFERRLRRAGFSARSVTVRARAAAGKGARHTVFIAERPRRESRDRS